MGKHAGNDVLPIVVVGDTNGVVDSTVEHTDLVLGRAGEYVAENLHAVVAVGRQVGREGPLVEGEIGPGLQALQAERRFERPARTLKGSVKLPST